MTTIKRLTVMTFTLLLCSCAATRPAGPLESHAPKPGQIIQYNTENELAYESHEQSTQHTFTLRYKVDGTSQTWDLTPYEPDAPINAYMVDEIVYLGPHQAWMFTHKGHIFQNAVLLDLKARRLEKGFAIGGPHAISPDGHQLAYSFPIGHNHNDFGVMVDNTLVYPIVKQLGDPKANPKRYRDTIGPPLELENHPFVAEIHDFFEWVDNDTLQFVAEERPESRIVDFETTGEFYEYTVKGLKKGLAGTPATLNRIKISRKKLTASEVLKRYTAYYQDRGELACFNQFALGRRLKAAAEDEKQ